MKLSRRGEIGIRARLKISWPQGRGGSTPLAGTNFLIFVALLILSAVYTSTAQSNQFSSNKTQPTESVIIYDDVHF
jgi:hypothetical protein